MAKEPAEIFADYYIPYVIEKHGGRERQYDIYSRLLEDRIIFIGTEVTDGLANSITAQLLFLQKENKAQDISMFINSPGGSVTAGLAIFDTMKYVQCDVATYCLGQAASMGAVLLAAGTKGKRFALPHARIMIHQPWGGAQGSATDINIQAVEINRMRTALNKILADACGKSEEQIAKDSDRDFFMSSAEAKTYGLVDEIVASLKDKK